MRSILLCLTAVAALGCDDDATDAADPVDATVADLGGEVDAEPDPDAGAPDMAPDAAPVPDAAAPDGPPAFAPEIGQTCPGDPGCEAAADTQLRVGASARVVSDLGFEKPKTEYLELRDDCNELQGERCGSLDRDFLNNCGNDRLCEDDEGYPGPDADGSEGDEDEDGVPYYDYFVDCGADELCEGDEGYPGPDEGEGNKRFDGFWIAGFSLNRPATGVRDHVFARTIALEQGNTLVAITSVDAVGLFYDDIAQIRERAIELLAERVPEADLDQLIVSATHSHEVPDTMGLWAGDVDPDVPIPLSTGVNARYIAHLREQTALSVVEAVEALQPATMRAGEGHTGVDGLIRDSRHPRIYNDRLGALRFSDMAGETIATLVNWGNHPETLGGDNNLISSDFAGPLRDAVEGGVPDSVGTVARDGVGGVCVYIQGTVGGLMTPLGVDVLDLEGEEIREPSFLRNDVYGWRIAETALDALDAAEEVAEPTLGFTDAEFLVPVHNRLYHLGFFVDLFDRSLHDWNEDGIIGPGNFPHVRTQIVILRIGPVTLYTVPGELFPELAIGGYDGAHSFGREIVDVDEDSVPDLSQAPGPPYLDDIMPGDFTWTIGLGQDELGYLVPQYDFMVDDAVPYLVEAPGDHYEETNSVGHEIVPRILQVLEMLAAHITEAHD